MNKNLICPVCSGASALLDVVDFNKTCEEGKGKFFDLSGTPVYYALCGKCSFCFAPELLTWSLEEFKQRIYNEEYVLVDPDCVEARPRQNAENLIGSFGDRAHALKHLDYGGGNGHLSELLNKANWQSSSYDPFTNPNVDVNELEKFDLITAFEVFEHVSDVKGLMSNLNTLLAPNGIILFSTLLTDGNIQKNRRIDWWYASPRNGHISLFSRESLSILAQQYSLNFGSFSAGFHILFTELPEWANHMVKKG